MTNFLTEDNKQFVFLEKDTDALCEMVDNVIYRGNQWRTAYQFIEVKTGGAVLSTNQKDVYQAIYNDTAILTSRKNDLPANWAYGSTLGQLGVPTYQRCVQIHTYNLTLTGHYETCY